VLLYIVLLLCLIGLSAAKAENFGEWVLEQRAVSYSPCHLSDQHQSTINLQHPNSRSFATKDIDQPLRGVEGVVSKQTEQLRSIQNSALEFESGFESYSLECPGCDASLRGTIDPADDKLVLSGTDIKSSRPSRIK
jgi:hypothetical protein